MRMLGPIEVDWLLRPFRGLRVSRSAARLWTIGLAVVVLVGITLAMAWLVLRKIGSLIHVYRMQPVPPETPWDLVALLALIAVALALGSVGSGFRARDTREAGRDARPFRWLAWTLAGWAVVAAIAAGLVAAIGH